MTSVSGPVQILGAGGHALVVAATLRAAGYQLHGFFDDERAKWGSRLAGVPVLGPISELRPDLPAVAGVGNNDVRRRWSSQPLEWLAVVHPTAYVEPSVRLGPGTVVFAGAVIQPETRIGAHVIVNTGASVDHECVVGDYCHLAPGSRLAGQVKIAEGAMLGIGAVVIPGRSVGAWAVVGAGAAVVRDVPDRQTVVGVPARPLKENR